MYTLTYTCIIGSLVCVFMWQVLSNREKRAMEEAKEGLSGTLMVALPELISKVQ